MEVSAPSPSLGSAQELASQWRTLARFATLVAILTAPLAFVWFFEHEHLSLRYAVLLTIVEVAGFRGLVDVLFRGFIRRPSLFGSESQELRVEDVIGRRRYSFWRTIWRLVWYALVGITLFWAVVDFFGHGLSWTHTAHGFLHVFTIFRNPGALGQFVVLPFFFLFNFLIFFGPLMAMGIAQIRGFQPGDAEWGVKLDDVRGQAEAKEEIRRIVALWQSGERFESHGGKRERGILFLGAPGTGKTMLAKAIATGFNCPFVTIPGSGFAQAQPLDAKILTPRGWTTMGEIRLGDEVIDPEGGTARVIGVYPQGPRQIFRVTFADGSSTECDADHLWQYKQQSSSQSWKVGPLRDLVPGRYGPFIPMVREVEFESGDLPVDPYLLGGLLGDGALSGTTPLLTSADAEVTAAVEAALPADMFVYSTGIRHSLSAVRKSRAAGSGQSPNPLVVLLRELGVWGLRSHEKFVPYEYLFASFEDRLSLLRGLMDTDGSASKGNAHFGTVSPRLAEAVQFLVQSLGGTARICAHPAKTYAHPDGSVRPSRASYTLNIGLPRHINPFQLERKREKWDRQYDPTRKIVAIEPTRIAEAQCIKLDSENELYVTDDFVVTHNTFIGLDAVLVRYLARKARRLARKWGGQCIVFIDEIDAVGTRRNALGTGSSFVEPTFEQSGDLVLETRAWRERLFAQRAPAARPPGRLNEIVNQAFPGMFGGMSGGLALNQLLVVMDGLDSPPLGRRMRTSFLNTLLDATYVVPPKVKGRSFRLRPPRPRPEQIYFIGATNVPIEQLDPALTRPGRLGRHVWFRTPTKQDRADVFALYLGRVSHVADLDRPERRDELARMTMGYSPAMIEQVCSMALTIAHHTGRDAFGWEDIVDAMTTVESGTAINIEYVPEETRAVAVHEAGHALAAHAYMKGSESTRLSIRRRGGSLGHHMALQKEERFSSWRSEELARLIWALGAMAAERVIYGETSTGVGGDVQAATDRAAWMVGACGMGPEWVDLDVDDAAADEARERVMKRLQKIGTQIINRTRSGGGMHDDPLGSVLSDPTQRVMVEQLLGQAYLTAHHLMAANRAAIDQVASVLVERRELHGDEVVALLERQHLVIPKVDLLQEDAWPRL